jgi:regulator of cell morphogenesis and NO signaling
MVDEHDNVARHLHAIESLSDNYRVPEDGCQSYRLYFQKLQELDTDLHQHIHLENNILFPKSIELEKELISA